MKVLVTGGAGYVGSTLVPMLLGAGHDVVVLDVLAHGGQALLGVWSDPRFRLIRGDICDGAVVEQAVTGMDAVVHLAAIVGDPACARAPELARQVNLDASLGLIAAAERAGVSRFVFASTCSNYGRMADGAAFVDETSPLAPVSLYAETKVAVEQALLDRPSRNGMAVTPLRFATVFGVSPRMRFDLTVNEFTLALLTERHLLVFGEQFWRPYVHVRDVARAIVLVLATARERIDAEVFNVGATSQNFQKQQLVELIRPHAPDAVVEYIKKQEDPRDYRVSFSKIATQLAYDITVPVPDGIAEIVRLVEAGIAPQVAVGAPAG